MEVSANERGSEVLNVVDNNVNENVNLHQTSVISHNNISNNYALQPKKKVNSSVIIDPTIKTFFEAIFQCNVEEIKEYFRNGNFAPWEWTDEEGYTCLHRACFMNMTIIVNLIFEEMKLRLNLDNKEETNQTGINATYSELMKKFVNMSSFNGSRAIHFASYRGNIEVIKKLISNHADIHTVNEKGLDVIHMAAQGDQPATLVFFREKYEMKLDSKDSLGNTPIHWACYMGSENFFSFILSYCDDHLNNLDINVQDSQGLAPIHLAVMSEKTKLVKKLLHKGANINIKDKKGRTPYVLAVEKNKTPIIEMLSHENGCIFSTNYLMRSNLEKTEKTMTNMLLFIILHLIVESGVFFFILPHLKWFALSVTFLVLFFLVMCFFIFLTCSDPGFEGYNLFDYRRSDKNFHPKKILLDLIEKNVMIDDYCPYCIINKSTRSKTKHCYYCNRCIKDFDHHCYWVNNCIGANNLNLFFIFITFVNLNLLLQIFVGFYGVFGVRMDMHKEGVGLGAETNSSSNLLNNFPPFFSYIQELHLYDTNTRRILCSVLIVICLCFLLPVSYLWIKNAKSLCLRMKKEKRDYQSSPRRIKESILEDDEGKGLVSIEKSN